MSGRNPKIVVVGASYVDMAVRCGQIPAPGQNIPGSELAYAGTGPGMNQAVQAALCGCEVYLVSKVGQDPFAGMVKAALANYDIKSDFVTLAKAKNTGIIVTIVDASGENASVTCAGANNALSPQDIEAAEDIIADADICLIHARLPKEAIVKAIVTAKLHARKVVLDPAAALAAGAAEQITALPAEYFTADVLIANLYEAALIAERSSANIRDAKLIGSELVARGAGAAVITMGKRGCMVVDRNAADHIPAFSIDLVDHTGTGDAFAGALAASLAVGDDLRKAVRFASAAGALACTKFGSLDAMPTKAEIIELMQKQEPE